MKKIAINGFGRIGRLFLRQILNDPEIEVVAINDLGDAANLAYLFKNDSVYRKITEAVKMEDGKLEIGVRQIPMLSEPNPEKLPWGELGVDLVVESSGAYEGFAKASAHLKAGAKKVIITAPAKDGEGVEGGQTVLMGINNQELKKTALSSNGSCTTNATAPVVQILAEKIGIAKAILNTIHSYTATQTIVDSPVKGSDWLRGRAGAENIIPSSTGAAFTTTRVVPELMGKFDGMAMRVPTIAGSVADITFLAKRKTSVEEVNEILRQAARDERWQGIFKVAEEPLVSSDIIGEPYAAIADLTFTRVVDNDLVKVLSWYDNEWGYVSTLVRHAQEALA